MKKLIYVIMTIFIMLLSGCDSLENLMDTKPTMNTNEDILKPVNSKPTDENKKVDETNEVTSKYTIKDYFPFKENIKYTYESKGMEYTTYTISVDYIRENKIQLRKNNGGTESIKVIENKNGELKLILSKEATNYREDLTVKNSDKEELLLKEPLVKGTSWTLSDGSKRFISNTNVQVVTPSGNYTALEVTTESKTSKAMDYYALDAGLIKTIFISDGKEVSSSLSKLQANSPLVQNIKFYYPNANDNKFYFIKKDLSFNTNDLTKLAIEKTFKEAPTKEVGKLLGANTKIKSLYLGKDNVVYVDFSKELVSEMNAGSGYEAMILQSITNTLGEYYSASKVYLTVENNTYSSGHILMKKGEYFTVNTKNSIEIKNK